MTILFLFQPKYALQRAGNANTGFSPIPTHKLNFMNCVRGGQIEELREINLR